MSFDAVGRRPGEQRSSFETLQGARSLPARPSRHGLSAADFDVVTRRAQLPFTKLGPALETFPAQVGDLEFDGPFDAVGGVTVPGWHTTGRLHHRGWRAVRWTRVDVEVNAWSRASIEVRMRPVSRRVAAWGSRRQRRYFQLAHRAIDNLVRTIAVAVRDVDGTPVIVDLRVAGAEPVRQ
jgi:hypothetical protein